MLICVILARWFLVVDSTVCLSQPQVATFFLSHLRIRLLIYLSIAQSLLLPIYFRESFTPLPICSSITLLHHIIHSKLGCVFSCLLTLLLSPSLSSSCHLLGIANHPLVPIVTSDYLSPNFSHQLARVAATSCYAKILLLLVYKP